MRYVPLAVVCLALLLPPLALRIESKWLSREPRDVDVDVDVEADFVVVLGYALKRDGEPTEVLQHRVRSGLRLWKQLWRSRAAPRQVQSLDNTGSVAVVPQDFLRAGFHHTPVLVFSGGHPGGRERRNKSEAEQMKDHALRLLTHDDEAKMRDIANDKWVLETLSTSTRENALFSLGKIKAMACDDENAGRRRQAKTQRVAIVTSKFHQFRSLLTFENAWRDIVEGTGAAEEEKENNTCRLEFLVSRVPEEEEEDLHKNNSNNSEAAASPSSYPIAYYSHSMRRRTINIFREIAAIVYYRARGWIELPLL
jgi:uncharacterized SAM-binding protein YcdF (DUF218 family)